MFAATSVELTKVYHDLEVDLSCAIIISKNSLVFRMLIVEFRVCHLGANYVAWIPWRRIYNKFLAPLMHNVFEYIITIMVIMHVNLVNRSCYDSISLLQIFVFFFNCFH